MLMPLLQHIRERGIAIHSLIVDTAGLPTRNIEFHLKRTGYSIPFTPLDRSLVSDFSHL